MVYYKDYYRNFRNKKDEAPPFANKFFKAITKPEQNPNKHRQNAQQNKNGQEPCGRGWGSGGTRFKNFLCERKILVAFFKISLYNYIIEIELGGAIRWEQIPQILKIYR